MAKADLAAAEKWEGRRQDYARLTELALDPWCARVLQGHAAMAERMRDFWLGRKLADDPPSKDAPELPWWDLSKSLLPSADLPCGGVTTGSPHARGTCRGCDIWNWGNPHDVLHYQGVTHPEYPYA